MAHRLAGYRFQFYLVRLISCSRYLPTWSNEISILPSTINIHFARHSFVSACISILPSTINILLPPSSHVICIFISILPSTINIWISLLLQELLNKFQFYLVRLIFNKSDSPSKTITKFQFYLVRLILTVLKLLTLHFAISILPSTINILYLLSCSSINWKFQFYLVRLIFEFSW